MATFFEQLDCYEAINLDGGGSSCLIVNGKETIKPSDPTGQRQVPAVFYVK
jgi:exopolysaccharide biosynthesis protein